MNELVMLEELLRTELEDVKPNQFFRSELKQKLLDRSVIRRKKVVHQWLIYALAGVIAGVAVVGVGTLLKKNENKLLFCGSREGSEGGS